MFLSLEMIPKQGIGNSRASFHSSDPNIFMVYISSIPRSELSDDDFNYQDWNTSFLSQTSHDSLGQQNELLKSFWLKWPDNKVVKKMINNISFIL